MRHPLPCALVVYCILEPTFIDPGGLACDVGVHARLSCGKPEDIAVAPTWTQGSRSKATTADVEGASLFRLDPYETIHCAPKREASCLAQTNAASTSCLVA